MKIYWTVIALLAASAGYVAFHPPRNLALGQALLQQCPTRFGEWNGEDLSFEDAVVEELQADDLLVRRYRRGEDVMWLCIIYHQNARYGAHDPQVCYDSQGYTVTAGPRARVGDDSLSVEVNTFLAERPHDRRLVYYWWYTDGLATHDREAFQRSMALRGALENRSWGAFVRVEALSGQGDDGRAARNCAEFSAEVLRALPGLFVRGSTEPRERS